ncbi:site-specific integrase [Desulfuromonas sp. KJ2020]|uniref:tyrosine-type recombinase/integrase n=1 Tax=Desulfuromonas sp. KJ2020 TaxID=2919173 RepID=UPI0020A77ACB|nr:site-specific integrase [Desulfuromonas sp. KJ2020]MCP3176096.1 site-specific integrase [Desulfuromonas sp. KJ2020]
MAIKYEKLTRPQMRRLEAGEKIEEHGIVFTRLNNGDGRFAINVMVDGQRIHRAIGKESEGVTREHVEAAIAGLRTKAREDRLNLPQGRKVAMGFREASKKYIENLEEEGGKDIKNKKRRLEQHLVPYFGNQPLSKITVSDIERYKEKRSKEKAVPGGEKNKPLDISTLKNTSNGTINRELAVLSHLFNKAIDWKWIPYRPCKVKLLPEESNKIVYLTREQISSLQQMSLEDENPHIHLFILIGIDTGMRKSEILAIRLEHIDINRKQIHVPEGKAGTREQPITGRLADVLKEVIENAEEGEEWLFPSAKSKTGHVTNLDKAFRRVVAAAGLDPSQIVRHTMRHTAVTHLVQEGIDLPTVMRISGHKTLAMVLRYAHQNGEHIQDAMDRLEQRLEGAS